MKLRKLFLSVCAAAILIGCGTDTKPSYFTNIIRSDVDVDGLAECLVETPVVDGDTLVVKSNIPCLTDLSNGGAADPDAILSVQDILRDPELYMDKLITVEGFVKRLHGGEDRPELFTNDQRYRFHIHSEGAKVYIAGDDNEKKPLVIGEKYRFRCRIYQLEINTDWGGYWNINAKLVVSQQKQILYLPEKVED